MKVDPDRIAVPLRGRAFDAAPFLVEELRRGLVDPDDVLVHTPESGPRVARIHVKPGGLLPLLEKMDAAGMLEAEWADAVPLGRLGTVLACGLFAVIKDPDRDRLITNRIPSNAEEHSMGASRDMFPQAACLCEFVLGEHQDAEVSVFDLPDYYHTIGTSRARALRNQLGQALCIEDVKHLQCVQRLLARDDSRWASSPVALLQASLPMGDVNATDFAHAAHVGALREEGAAGPDVLVSYRAPAPPGLVWELVMIDDNIITRAYRRVRGGPPGPAPGARGPDPLEERALRAYDNIGLAPKPEKTTLYARTGVALGAIFDGRDGWTCAKPGHFVLAFGVLGAAVEAKGCSASLAAGAVSLMTHALLMRRDAFSLADRVYPWVQRLVDEAERPGGGRQYGRMGAAVADEIRLIASVCCLLGTDLRAQVHPEFICTDARGGRSPRAGVCRAALKPAVARDLWRYRVRRGGAAYLDGRALEEAKRLNQLFRDVGVPPDELLGVSDTEFEFDDDVLETRQWVRALIEQLDWTARGSFGVNLPKFEHVNLSEYRALRIAVRRLIREGVRFARIPLGTDSNVVLGACAKGRSGSRRLRRLQQGLVAQLLFYALYLGVYPVASEDNPADDPSRQRAVRAFTPPVADWAVAYLDGYLGALTPHVAVGERERWLRPMGAGRGTRSLAADEWSEPIWRWLRRRKAEEAQRKESSIMTRRAENAQMRDCWIDEHGVYEAELVAALEHHRLASRVVDDLDLGSDRPDSGLPGAEPASYAASAERSDTGDVPARDSGLSDKSSACEAGDGPERRVARRVDLRCPFAEKDAAKALGARWDRRAQLWYAPPRTELNALRMWIPTDVRDELGLDPFYVSARPWSCPDGLYEFRATLSARGAVFNRDLRRWVVPAGVALEPLRQWLPAGALDELERGGPAPIPVLPHVVAPDPDRPDGALDEFERRGPAPIPALPLVGAPDPDRPDVTVTVGPGWTCTPGPGGLAGHADRVAQGASGGNREWMAAVQATVAAHAARVNPLAVAMREAEVAAEREAYDIVTAMLVVQETTANTYEEIEREVEEAAQREAYRTANPYPAPEIPSRDSGLGNGNQADPAVGSGGVATRSLPTTSLARAPTPGARGRPAGRPDGRPPRDRTLDLRVRMDTPQRSARLQHLWDELHDFAAAEGYDWDSILEGNDPRPAIRVVEDYGQRLWMDERARGDFTEVLNALWHHRGDWRRMLGPAWDFDRRWQLQETGQHHVPMPWQVALAVVVLAVFDSQFAFAVTFLVCFVCGLRPGEALSLLRRSLIFPADGVGLFVAISAALGLRGPKSAALGREQHVYVQEPLVVDFVRWAVHDLGPLQRVAPTDTDYLRLWQRYLGLILGLSVRHGAGLTPASLRAGCATELYRRNVRLDDIGWVLRHVDLRTLRSYIQEAVLAQSRLAQTPAQQQTIARLASHFQCVLTDCCVGRFGPPTTARMPRALRARSVRALDREAALPGCAPLQRSASVSARVRPGVEMVEPPAGSPQQRVARQWSRELAALGPVIPGGWHAESAE